MYTHPIHDEVERDGKLTSTNTLRTKLLIELDHVIVRGLYWSQLNTTHQPLYRYVPIFKLMFFGIFLSRVLKYLVFRQQKHLRF